ncbi:hypothetical protein JCM5350_006953 [Sporobolomyces pararoseus]
MGRTGSPRKASPSARTLSSRITAPSALTFAPSPLSRSSLNNSSTSTSPAGTPLRSSSPMAPKRSIDEVAPTSTETSGNSTPKSNHSLQKNKRQRHRKNKRDQIAAKLGEPGESVVDLEEGEVVEGDFSDLFMVDTTPAAVSNENRFAPASPTTKKDSTDDNVLLQEEEEETFDEEDIMKVFAKEVAMTDDEENDSEDDDTGSSEDDEDRSGINIEGMMLYDDEEGLKEAIQGKIVDDSSAPVAGRYYKEADLTKSCVLCGEHGHSSRDCTHSQCFICGQIDVEHEARNCPVSLICSACGSRGHFARDCDIAPGHGRYGGHMRCSICQSNNHSSSNCSTLWRIYDVSGPKPQKRKIVCACANCGSTKDHFIDDCLLPRGHPMKYADSSAFNRSALGASGSSLPQYSAGGPTSSASSRRRAGGASSRSKRYDDDYDSSVGGGGAADDDWFASRARTASSGGGGGGGGRESKSSARSSNWKDLKAAKGRGLGGGGGSSGTHIHFGGLSDSSRDRFSGGGGGSASSSRSYGGHDRSGNGSGYDSPRETWKKASYERPSDRRGPPSLLDRVGGGGGGGGSNRSGGGSGSNRKPRYQGGYV